jgi:hypothetical protein
MPRWLARSVMVLAVRPRAAALVLALVALSNSGCAHPPPGPGPAPLVAAPASKPPPPRQPEEMVFDLGRDFSFASNPNGPWRYGYTRGKTLRRAEFVPATAASVGGAVGFWQPASGKGHRFPYVAANVGPTTARDDSGSWAVRPGEVALEASKSGQFAVVEFTVPADGSYAISADFAGIHRRLSSTDVHVLLDDEPLFSATVEGYGGDPSFLPRQGPHPSARFQATRRLRAGSILSFAVGVGPTRTPHNDTTGLMVTIRAERP